MGCWKKFLRKLVFKPEGWLYYFWTLFVFGIETYNALQYA